MTDDQAETVLRAILNLAVIVRDEGPDAVDTAALDVFMKAGGDCTAALVIAAALIPADQPVDAWWNPPAVRAVEAELARRRARRPTRAKAAA